MEWAVAATIIGLVLNFIISWDARKTVKLKKAEAEEHEATALKIKAEAAGALAEAEQARATAQNMQAEASNSLSQSVKLLIDPLNASIVELEGGMKALNEEAKVLRLERELRERQHREEIEIMKQTQAKEIAAFKSTQDAMRREVDELTFGVGILAIQLQEAGLEPRWYPKNKPGTGPLKDK